ncbi:MAG: NAD/NADP octopine/nopaline dehydrogenase family protein [Bacillota bacterium]
MNIKKKKTKWAVIGGGNGGQSAAGHLGIMGFPVTLYDIMPDTVNAINSQGGIHVDGAVKGFGKIEKATTDIGEAIQDAEIIMVILPSNYHRSIAKAMAPYVNENQIVFIHPGATFGAFQFKQVFKEEGCSDNIVIAEAQSLIYACRLNKPGYASIKGMKKNLMVAAIPANKTQEVVIKIQEAFPDIIPGKNVLDTSLNNLNAIMHPGPTLLNVSMIESPYDWRYYWDGITPTIGEFIVEMDKERIDMGEKLGLSIPPILEMYKTLYGVEGSTLTEVVRKTKAYEEVMGQKRVDTRYLTEDIPMSLVPFVSMAQQLGMNSDKMETICRLGSYILKEDFFNSSRTMENLGFEKMTAEEIIEYAETGIK